MISIFLLQLCDKSICKSLNIIFKSCLTQGIFPSEWKKANVAPIHKKNKNKQCIKNCRHTSSPNLQQSFTAYYFPHNVHIFYKKQPISKNTSGFKCGDSCVNRLLAITQEIFFSFDDNYKVRGVLLGISNAFNKKSHKGIYS